jgi:hypothetical protein
VRNRGRVLSALMIFAFYALIGTGILVEVSRRLGAGFIVSRAELTERKAEASDES